VERNEQSSEHLLAAISRVQSHFIDDAESESVCGMLLQELLKLSGSEYGVICEVVRDAEQAPYLRMKAIRALTLSEEVNGVTAQTAQSPECRNLMVLCERVLTTREPVMLNDPGTHEVLSGHSVVNTLLALPIDRGKQLLGIVGLAKRSGGYDEAGLAYLEPFLSTCAQLLEGFHNRRLKVEAENALRLREDRFRAAIQGANDGIWDWNLDTNETYFSPRWKTMLGYEDAELASAYSEWESRLHPDDRDSVLAQLGRYLNGTADRYDVEFRMRKKNGDYCWINARGSLVRGDDGKPVRMAGSHTDITERKRIEALHGAEKRALEMVAKGERLEEVLGFVCQAVERLAPPVRCSVMLADAEGTHLSLATAPNLPADYNRAISRIPIGAAIGSCGSAAYWRTPVIVADIAVDPLWKDYVSVALTHGLKACWSLPIISASSQLLGTLAVYHSEPRMPQSTDLKILERVCHIVALAIGHARMTEALRESEARFDAFMRHSPVVTFIKDESGHHAYVNPRFESLFGISREESKRKTVFDFLPADIATRLRENDQTVLSSGKARESEETVPAANGMMKDWLVIKFPLEIGVKRMLGGVAVDITERKSLERETRDQADRLRLAMDIARLATWDWNILTNQVIWSENCEEVKGLPQGSFDGTFEAYQRLVHPDDLPRLLADIEDAISGRQPYHTEHRIVPPSGDVEWVEGNGVVYRDELGRPIRMVGTVRNITQQKRMEQALRLSEERYARATAVGRVGVWELDVQAGSFYGDPNLKSMYGYQPDELSADPFVWFNLVHPDDQSIAMAHWERIVRRETDDYVYEARMIKKDGTVIWTDVRGHAIRTADGQLTHVIGATLDTTARKQSEMSLLRTQFAMDQAVDAVYWIDPQARILYTNEAATAMLGYTADEFLRMTVHDLNPEFPAEVWPGFWAESREKKVISLETVHLTKDGRRIPIDIRVSFLAYGGQEFHCAYVRDISERKRTDQALHESQERFELAAIASNDGIWDWNILTGEQYWSDRHLELFGLKPGELAPTYETWISMLHPDDAELVHQATCRHLESRAPYDIETRVRMKDGFYRWFRDRGQAVWNELGRPVRMVGSISDVTERRQAEEAIWRANSELEQRVAERTKELARANQALEREIDERKRVEDRLQRTQYAVDHAADQIFVIDSRGYFVDVNESACRRLGYRKEELLTMSVMDIDPDFSPEVWLACWATLTKDQQLRIETRHRSKSGEIYPVEVVANYLCHNGQELDYAVVRDVSERRQAEAAIRESELRYKLLTEATFDGVALHDDGVLLEVNPGLERMFGYQPGELIGRSIFDLVVPEQRAQAIANMRQGVEGPYEIMGLRKDGSTIVGEVVVRPYWYRGKQVRLVAGRDIMLRKQMEAQQARYLEELERQVAERTSEIAKLQAQRAQTEKLAAVGQMAAAVAHEINNPIAGIRNAFTLVKQAVDPTHPHFEFVAMIDREITRVASIVQNMYQLYRKEPSKAEPVNLSLLIRDLESLFAKRLSQLGLTLVVTQMPLRSRLLVPQSDLLQVLMNLVQNALDSSRQGGTIWLNVCQDEDIVRMSVSDEGSGIPPDVLPHIFDPFFTTKTEKGQKGMGLGLSVSQSLVMAMGGRMEVQTEQGAGSTFSIILPECAAESQVSGHRNIIQEVLTHET
jgi:PAS domain S-box-containing protein